MRMLRWFAVLLICLPSPALAQNDSGRISGTVRDQSSAFVGDATITVRSDKTGETRSASSNQEGFFVIPALKPATYTVTVTKQGFAPVEYPDMRVAVGQELVLDFEFKPAGVTESVTVGGIAPVLDVSSAKIGASVSEREVQGLPVNGRQMSQLMLQAPGSQNAGTGTWGDIRFSGRAVEQNVVKYDGVEASGIIDSAPGVANGENATPFKLQTSLENVQEFRVESSGYPAEFGTGTGGQVSVITKSGGNQFRGSAFEYFRNQRLDSQNHFDSPRNPDDSIITQLPKSLLKQNQFGGSIGGPVIRDRAFFFGSYEGYRLHAGKNFVEAVPSAAAWARAVPAVASLRPGFTAPDAIILAGASANADFDIAQLQATQDVTENSFGGRVDFKLSDNWSAYGRVFRDQAESVDPQGVTGRFFRITLKPTNAVFNLQGLLGTSTINEFKVGYNAAPSTESGPTQAGFENISINLSGSVANNGIAGQSGNSGIASPGGLVRVNSAGNGRGAPYNPYSLTFADSLSRVQGNHYLKLGADVRLIRMTTDQLGGTTYTFANITGFLANTPTQIQYFGDLSEPSPFHDGATGLKHIRQEYYVGYAQDEWRVRSNFTLNYGVRYDYYVPLREVDNRIVKLNITNGVLDPDTTDFYSSKKNNVQPRVSATYSPTSKTVLRAGVGIFVGPGQTEDQIQPIEAERISTTLSSGPLLAFPVDAAAIRANFTTNPNNRTYQPRAYSNDYTLPEKVYQYTASVQRELFGGIAASAAYVGSQGRNLFLRSITNQIIGVQTNGTAAATLIREFDLVTRNADGTIATIQRPYAEIDYKTSGGHDRYDALQLALTRRSSNGLALNAQYTLGKSQGNTGGSNEAATSGANASFSSERPANRVNLADFEYDNGYNNFDVRHTFNLSALYAVPGSGPLVGGWSIGGIANARSGLPIAVLIGRNDVVYVDGAGNAFLNPAADRTAVINTPGGGASRSTRRPDLIPGVDPYIKDGGLVFLNPAAFSTPKPGSNGNLERNLIHGPRFHQIDMVVSKRVGAGRGPSGELRLEVFNVFNVTNFAGIVGTLPNALPANSLTEANKVQPGQPYTTGAAGTFGRATSTVGTTVGIGTNRQIQLAFRFSF